MSEPAIGATPSQREMLAGEDAKMRSPSFRPGSVIADKYVIDRVIGEGGLGVVVAARHRDLEQTVAIKYLRPKVLNSKVVVERFLREARLAAKIRSQHVVRVFDVGTVADGTPYMIMEHLEGTDLGHVLASGGPLPLDKAVEYVLQGCEALAEAHAFGIVHRDLKPENLFLARVAAGKTVVKVLDFGISKLSAKRSETGRLSRAELTEANDQFGTPVYMSPEQLRSSGDVDPRADVWAIGVILYELLTGLLPFEGEGLPELCTAILTEAPASLATVTPLLPESARVMMQAIVDRCLQKDREQRFQNVAELAQELRPFASPSAQAIIDHIVSIAQESGEHVRPSVPAPSGVQTRPTRDAATITPAETRAALTTSSGAASWGPMLTQQVAALDPKRARMFVLVAAAAVVVFAVGLIRLHGDAGAAGPPRAGEGAAGDRSTPAKPSGVPETVVFSPPAPEPVVLPSPAQAESQAPHEPEAGAGPSAHAEMAPSGAKARGPVSAKSASTARPAPGAVFDRNAVINPFQ